MSATAASSGDATNRNTGQVLAPQMVDDGARPSARRRVLASVLTPSWSLGLLLFVCLSLPAYRGCNDQVVYVGSVFAEVEPTADSVYLTFLVTWPFFFGLLVAVGTLWIALAGKASRARLLWRLLAALVIVNMVLMTTAFVASWLEHESSGEFGQEMLDAWWLLLPSLAALALMVFTARRRRDYFQSAMWLQCGLAVLAAVSVSLVTPGFLLAKEFLLGGILAIAASVFLILATVVSLLDGRRALARRAGESPLQLSLKAMLLLMLLGGVACSWIGTFLVAEVPTEQAESRER